MEYCLVNIVLGDNEGPKPPGGTEPNDSNINVRAQTLVQVTTIAFYTLMVYLKIKLTLLRHPGKLRILHFSGKQTAESEFEKSREGNKHRQIFEDILPIALRHFKRHILDHVLPISVKFNEKPINIAVIIDYIPGKWC